MFHAMLHAQQEFPRDRPGQGNEPRHDKTNKMAVHPSKTQVSLGILPVWSESSLSAGRKLGSLATHWAHSNDSDQPGPDQTRRMHRLIWVFAGRTHILLILSCRGSNVALHKWMCVLKTALLCALWRHFLNALPQFWRQGTCQTGRGSASMERDERHYPSCKSWTIKHWFKGFARNRIHIYGCLVRIENFETRGNCSASLWKPHDAEQLSLQRNF